MHKVLFILGIASIVIAVIALLYAALQRFAYYHTLDGDSDMYARMHLHMIVSFVISIVFAIAAVVCFVIRSKM
ncbi:MAG: hypothetical protein IJM59_13920 [Proteobacteria bacterium]|nr:hypothetical protein [Pseudomonadota bacterium]